MSIFVHLEYLEIISEVSIISLLADLFHDNIMK